jgi:predicted nucleic acid-binding protein
MTMANKFRVVIDTNVLLVSISSKSKYHWLFRAIINQDLEVYITNKILNEYEEKIEQHWSISTHQRSKIGRIRAHIQKINS